MQKTITKIIILLAVLTLALGANYIFAAWIGPTEVPPGGNTPTPVHIGTTNQVKDGGLSLNALSVFGGGYFSGNVGVGVVTPTQKLEVDGGVEIGNATNGTAGTIRWTGTDFEGYNGTEWKSLTASSLTTTTSGKQTFTTDGTFTVPDGVTKVYVTMSGGGGGGNAPVYFVSSAKAPENGGDSSFGDFIVTAGGKGSGGSIYNTWVGGKSGGEGGEDGFDGYKRPFGGSGGDGGEGGNSLFGVGGKGGKGGAPGYDNSPGSVGSPGSGYGAGGGGHGGHTDSRGYGGGGAAAVNSREVAVTSGMKISVKVGGGGGRGAVVYEGVSADDITADVDLIGASGAPGFVTVEW